MLHADLARAFLDTITDQDWDAFRALTTPDLTQQILPQSFGRPESDRETWITQLKETRAMIPDWRITIRGGVIGDDSGISFYATGCGTSATNLPYKNEYMIILRLSQDETGKPKISRVEEMVDSAVTLAFFAKHRAALQNSRL